MKRRSVDYFKLKVLNKKIKKSIITFNTHVASKFAKANSH
jgi:hypothetical protein